MFAWGEVGVKFRTTLRRPPGTALGVGPDRGTDCRKTPELKTPDHLRARLYFSPVPCNDASRGSLGTLWGPLGAKRKLLQSHAFNLDRTQATLGPLEAARCCAICK